MRPRRPRGLPPLIAIALMAWLPGGCLLASKFDRGRGGGDAEIAGRVVDARGRGVADATVALELDGAAQPAAATTTRRDGRFEIATGTLLFAAAERGTVPTVRLTARGRGGAGTIRFRAGPKLPRRIPDLMLWDGRAELEVTDETVRLAESRLPKKLCDERPELRLRATREGGGATLQASAGQGMPRLWLQELAWTLSPVAAARAEADGVDLECESAGTPLAVAGLLPPPLTRGRPPRVIPPGLRFAGLVDGELSDALIAKPGRRARIELAFGTPVAVRHVLLFGLALAGDPGVVVETPGSSTPLARARHDGAAVLAIALPDHPPSERLVVRFPGTLEELAEVAAYGAVDPAAWTAAQPVSPYSHSVESVGVR